MDSKESEGEVSKVWMVEMKNNGRWLPCVTCRLTREDGRAALPLWRALNPDDRFRVAPYVRAKKARGK